MNTRIDTHGPRADRRSHEPSGRLRATLAAAREGFRKARRRRLAIRELASLSDAALNDIGISRDQIPDLVDGMLARHREIGVTADRTHAGRSPSPCGEACPA